MDSPPAPLPDLVLWRSERCHLCEETAELLGALFAERSGAGAPVPRLVVRPIADDPAALVAYRDDVPVLEAGGRRLLLATRLGPIRAFLDDVYGGSPAPTGGIRTGGMPASDTRTGEARTGGSPAGERPA